MLRPVVLALLAVLASLTGSGSPARLPSAVPRDPSRLAADLDLAQTTIDDPSSDAAELASAGQFEQLATATLAREPLAAMLAGLD